MNVTKVQTRPKKVCHCSYCLEAGHNIKSCKHRDLKEFHRDLRNTAFTYYIERLEGSDSAMYRFYKVIENKVWGPRNIDIGHGRMNYTSESLILYLMNHKIPKKTLYSRDTIIHAIVKLHCCSDASEAEYKSLLQESCTSYLNEITDMRVRNRELNRRKFSENNKRFEVIQVLKEYENTKCECEICMNEDISQDNMVKLKCAHELCKDCFKRIAQIKLNCPFCRNEIKEVETKCLNVVIELQNFKQSY